MRQLVYVSSATHLMSDSDLEEILTVSRRNNAAQNITGMLLYIDGSFLQVLEGADDEISAVYGRIWRDIRHKGCRVLVDQSAAERLFAGWSMGFDRPDETSSTDAFRITRDAIAQALPSSGAREIVSLLHTFYYVNTRERLG